MSTGMPIPAGMSRMCMPDACCGTLFPFLYPYPCVRCAAPPRHMGSTDRRTLPRSTQYEKGRPKASLVCMNVLP